MPIWSGLGIQTYSTTDTSTFDAWIDSILAWGFNPVRIDIPFCGIGTSNDTNINLSKAAVIRAIAKGANVIWGLGIGYTASPITAENIAARQAKLLEAALWAQENGVYELALGNEEERHNFYRCVAGTIVRVSNVCTVTTPYAHGFDGTHQVTVYGATPANMNGTFDITVTDSTHFTYTAAGDNESNVTTTAEVYDITRAQVIAALKATCTLAQAIYIRGNISTSMTSSWHADWVTAGRGDFDYISYNLYQGSLGSVTWKTYLDAAITGFGTDHTYISEFGVNSTSLATYSSDEDIQAIGVTKMLEYIQSVGITRAIFFCYNDEDTPTGPTGFGALKTDDTYRLLFNSLTSKRRWFVLGGDTVAETRTVADRSVDRGSQTYSGFEGGDTSEWSSVATNGGDLSITTLAAIHGNYGLSCLVNDTTDEYVQDDTPNDKYYRCRFYFDPNSITMTNGDVIVLLQGFVAAMSQIFWVNFTKSGATYTISATIRDDASTYSTTSTKVVTDAPHSIEVYFRTSTAAGANNGFISLYLDDVLVGSKEGIDNDTRTLGVIRLGAIGKDAGSSGTIFFDDFYSNNTGKPIGVIPPSRSLASGRTLV